MRALAIASTTIALLAPAAAGASLTSGYITAEQARQAIRRHIFKKVGPRLLGTHTVASLCSFATKSGRAATATQAARSWRCMLTIEGARFPAPCKAEADVSGSHTPHAVHINWLSVGRYCRS